MKPPEGHKQLLSSTRHTLKVPDGVKQLTTGTLYKSGRIALDRPCINHVKTARRQTKGDAHTFRETKDIIFKTKMKH